MQMRVGRHPAGGKIKPRHLRGYNADPQFTRATEDLEREAAAWRSILPGGVLGAPEEEDAPETIEPVDIDARSANELRPRDLDEMIGQEKLKPILRRLIDAAKANGRPLDHLLLVGASGTGKTTLATVVAHELGARVFQLSAPVSHEQLEQLAEAMRDGDVLFIDEIHQQVAGDRRGVSSAAAPEHFYHVMEDRRLATPHGVMEFPAITLIGATTDAGLLPEPFLQRFPLQPRLAPYTEADMERIGEGNAAAFGLTLNDDARVLFARAARAIPRQMNRYMRNAKSLCSGIVSREVAREVVEDLNATTLDGLTLDMRRMLTFLYTSGKREVGGETRYQASVNNIATALGKSRDTKAVALYVEPWLIEKGLVQVGHGGRLLTPAGVKRARELTA